jgi:hypothetical protein
MSKNVMPLAKENEEVHIFSTFKLYVAFAMWWHL